MKKQLQFRLRLYAFLFGLISLNGYGQAQIGEDIIGSGHLGLGEAMSLSEDGNTVAIGTWAVNWYAPNDNNHAALWANNTIYGNNGSVRVYTKKVLYGDNGPHGVGWEQVGDFIYRNTL